MVDHLWLKELLKTKSAAPFNSLPFTFDLKLLSVGNTKYKCDITTTCGF